MTRYLNDSSWTRAKDLVSLALQQNPQDPSLIQTLATVEDKLRKQKLERNRIDSRKSSLMQAVSSFKKGDLGLAREKVELYFKLGGQGKEAFLLQNAILLKTKDYKDAVNTLNIAISKFP